MLLLTWHRKFGKKVMNVDRVVNERLKEKKRESNTMYKRKHRQVKTKQVIKEEERRQEEDRHVRRYLTHKKIHMPASCGFMTERQFMIDPSDSDIASTTSRHHPCDTLAFTCYSDPIPRLPFSICSLPQTCKQPSIVETSNSSPPSLIQHISS